ncbi:hypothetical protein K2Z83_24350 [Oscillochloris sp. ZM17-4]|uniref:hypothetical protein n=1 Tax=Oscillochloris sp. ZM17-4 TaxID=2866714 RepID=UPI001C733033|nr:hypothetical protein [Oscillochloris sp. ZM17-4]MBX0330793.1 hypothetical protein [Oscillochloris sp. ZM17-4]
MAKYDEDNNPYSWMPGFLRRFLNLTYDETSGNASSSTGAPSFASAPSSTARATWSSPSEPTFKASNMESYAPPSGGFAPPSGGMTPPPPPAPRPTPDTASAGPSLMGPSGSSDGIQPVTYLLRASIHGMLPPQGIEAFSKEVRATSTDVWNLYTHWARFQTEDIFRFGGEILRTVSNMLPTSSHHSAGPARRITVTVANGNGNGNGNNASATPPTPTAAATSPTPTAAPAPVTAATPPTPAASATPPASATHPAPVAQATDKAKPGEAKAPDSATKGPKDAPNSGGKGKK